MSRTRGSRNADFAESRAVLARRLAARLLEPDGVRASLRELAVAAGVTPPTLRHYFTDRDGAVSAAFAALHAEGAPYLSLVARPPEEPFPASVRFLMGFLLEGLRNGVARQLVSGLAEAGTSPVIGRACVTECLEPTLQAIEARLHAHQRRGEMRAADTRAAALALAAPVVLAMLHQDTLDGAAVRPLPMPVLLEELAGGFVRAYAA